MPNQLYFPSDNPPENRQSRHSGDPHQKKLGPIEPLSLRAVVRELISLLPHSNSVSIINSSN
jgi:hypothetical protein